jgi:hypothetical protein
LWTIRLIGVRSLIVGPWGNGTLHVQQAYATNGNPYSSGEGRLSMSGPLLIGFDGFCANCHRHVTTSTSRFWHSDEEGSVRLCYPCFNRRWTELATLPSGRDAYMREILANETWGHARDRA